MSPRGLGTNHGVWHFGTSPATPVRSLAPASAPAPVDGSRYQRGLDRTGMFSIVVWFGEKHLRRCVHSCAALAGVPCSLSDAGNPTCWQSKANRVHCWFSVNTEGVLLMQKMTHNLLCVATAAPNHYCIGSEVLHWNGFALLSSQLMSACCRILKQTGLLYIFGSELLTETCLKEKRSCSLVWLHYNMSHIAVQPLELLARSIFSWWGNHFFLWLCFFLTDQTG